MLEVLKRLLSPEYLIVSEPGPLGNSWLLYTVLAILFTAGLGLALWLLLGPEKGQRSEVQRAWAWFELWICLAGLGAIAGRVFGWPGWSARIWPYSLALLALGGALAYRFRGVRLPGWLNTQLRILGFLALPEETPEDTSEAPKKRWLLWYLLGILVHLTGITIVLTIRYHWPWWTAPLALLVLLLPQVPTLAHRHPPALMPLTPLLGAYLVTVLWLLYQWLGITVIGWQGLVFPNPLVSLFYVDGIVLACVAYAYLCQAHVMSIKFRRTYPLWRWAVIALLAGTLAWAGVVYFDKRTHGATASDPYAYAQMGVDLAERGTFLHRFSLFEQVMPLQIAWAPLQPVGYHIPRNDLGDCPSVWATGASVLLAAGYRILGESGLYVTTPIVAIIALAATWALVQETLRGEPKSVKHLTGALSMALLATSPEHVDRLLVPMADAPAQLFTVLTLLFALRGMRKLEQRQQGLWDFLLAGICFAWAYWVRHTQLVLALPVILAILLGNRNRLSQGGSLIRSLVLPLLAFSVATLVAALPDIIYRWRVFGGPFAPRHPCSWRMGLSFSPGIVRGLPPGA
jgi:hypothetical protein